MTLLAAFLHLLYELDHSPSTCSAIAGTPARVLYQGNCLQAFLLHLYDHTVGFVVNP